MRESGLFLLIAIALLGALAVPALATLQQPPGWSVAGQSAGERIGVLALAGDFDGNGADDLVVTARLTNTADAYLWFGAQGAPLSDGYNSWDWEWCLADTPDAVVAGAVGDFDGNGVDDLVLGAALHSNPPVAAGWYGAAGAGISCGPGDTSDWLVDDNTNHEDFARNMAAGDFDGDGYDDLALTRKSATADGSCGGGYRYETVVYAYPGSSSGLDTTASWSASLGDADCTDADAFLTAGDIDGDGYDDLVAVSNRSTSATGVQVFFGGSTGLPAAADWSIAEGGEFSAAVGDVDGDGYADLFLSGPNDGVFGWYGGPLGLPSGATYGSADWSYYDAGGGLPGGPSTEAAYHMAVGDVNGDGYNDLLIGEPFYDDSGLTDNGAVFVFYGSASGLIASTHSDPAVPADADEALFGTENGERFGYTVTAGNFDAQYGWDVAAGAPFYGADDRGRALGFYASNSPTATPTDTPIPPTATPTNTPIPPTATPTNTPVPPTPTDTPVPPTATPTNTPIPPTPTDTPVPPTATPTDTSPSPTPTDTPVPPTETPPPGGPATLYLPLVARGVQTVQHLEESEPNDTFDTADVAPVPAVIAGHHDGQAETGDVFALALSAGDKVHVSLVTGDETGVQVVVYDTNKDELTRDFAAPFDVSFVAVGDGVYFVYVFTPAEADNTAAYTLTVERGTGFARRALP